MQRNSLGGRLTRVRNRIAEAAERAGRDPSAVRLVGVTKGHPFGVVETALAAGLSDLGENRVEALVERAGRIPAGSCRWHMIGRLQRRQAPELHGVADLVHSVDSVRLAERLDRTRPAGSEPLRVLVQVNTSGEDAKTGFTADAAVEGVGAMLELHRIRVEGLMTMAPLTDDPGVLRTTFAALAGVGARLARELPGYEGRELSMGMSNDYEVAVEEGSTIVRLGTALFGEREG
jgi:PLP dependent protein